MDRKAAHATVKQYNRLNWRLRHNARDKGHVARLMQDHWAALVMAGYTVRYVGLDKDLELAA